MVCFFWVSTIEYIGLVFTNPFHQWNTNKFLHSFFGSKPFETLYIHIYIYRYIPRIPISNDLYFWRSTPPPKETRPFPIKTRVIWVLGVYLGCSPIIFGMLPYPITVVNKGLAWDPRAERWDFPSWWSRFRPGRNLATLVFSDITSTPKLDLIFELDHFGQYFGGQTQPEKTPHL